MNHSTFLPILTSPLQTLQLYGRLCYIKRDDLIGPVNGNKARKLYSLIKNSDNSVREIVSCGGNQSNLMYALSILAVNKGWKFTYYTSPIPRWLKESPSGNYETTLENNANIVEITTDNLNQYAQNHIRPDVLFIPQGGHFNKSEPGIIQLANEIKTQFHNIKNPDVDILLSSGTGTTAFYLARHLPGFRIVTFACVSGTRYLKEQMRELGEIPRNILFLETENKIPFGEPVLEYYYTYTELVDQGIEFDLIYDSAFWTFIKNRWKNNQPVYSDQKNILFIHSGGLHGNPSQLKRYKRKYPFILP